LIYLILSILCSSAIFLIFRSFKQYKVHTYTAIVINYLTAGCIGFLMNFQEISALSLLDQHWLPYALLLGSIFIFLFNIMAITTQKLGASVGSIANKMALIIPVIFAIIYYNDQITFLKVLGIFFALAGILLSTLKPKTLDRSYHKSDLLYPLILFLGSGFIDTYMKFVETKLLTNSLEFQLFSSATFSTAFIIGAIIMLIDKKRRIIKLNNFVAGSVLGSINFCSIYFLLEAFRRSKLESSVIFPLNNVGVVILTVFFSAMLFKERFNLMNKTGILLSIIAVILIALGQ